MKYLLIILVLFSCNDLKEYESPAKDRKYIKKVKSTEFKYIDSIPQSAILVLEGYENFHVKIDSVIGKQWYDSGVYYIVVSTAWGLRRYGRGHVSMKRISAKEFDSLSSIGTRFIESKN